MTRWKVCLLKVFIFGYYPLLSFGRTGPVVFIFWAKQAVSDRVAEDVERLYPPGRIYHFVYKQPGHPGHRPIRARVVPAENVKGRFERLVLSSSATTSNHFILTLTKHLKVSRATNGFICCLIYRIKCRHAYSIYNAKGKISYRIVFQHVVEVGVLLLTC